MAVSRKERLASQPKAVKELIKLVCCSFTVVKHTLWRGSLLFRQWYSFAHKKPETSTASSEPAKQKTEKEPKSIPSLASHTLRREPEGSEGSGHAETTELSLRNTIIHHYG